MRALGWTMAVLLVFVAGCEGTQTSAERERSQLPSNTAPPANPSAPPAPSSSALSSSAPAGPGAVCGTVRLPTGSPAPVAVLKGEIECATAMRIAQGYLSGKPAGQGQYLEVEGWLCQWPTVPGRSHAESYLRCDDDPRNPGKSFRIGD
jgi:hypothetical protein